MTVAQDFNQTMSEIRNLNRRGNMDTPFSMSPLAFCSKRARTMYQKMLDRYIAEIKIDKELGIIDEEKVALYEKSASDMQRTIDRNIWF